MDKLRVDSGMSMLLNKPKEGIELLKGFFEIFQKIDHYISENLKYLYLMKINFKKNNILDYFKKWG